MIYFPVENKHVTHLNQLILHQSLHKQTKKTSRKMGTFTKDSW